MKHLSTTIIALLLITSPYAFAKGLSVNTSTAGEIYTACKTDFKSVAEDPYADPDSTMNFISCIKYLEGFVEGHEAVIGSYMLERKDDPNSNSEDIRIFCMPKGETKGKIIQKVLEFFEKRKENLALMNANSMSALTFAFKSQYPCKQP